MFPATPCIIRFVARNVASPGSWRLQRATSGHGPDLRQNMTCWKARIGSQHGAWRWGHAEFGPGADLHPTPTSRLQQIGSTFILISATDVLCGYTSFGTGLPPALRPSVTRYPLVSLAFNTRVICSDCLLHALCRMPATSGIYYPALLTDHLASRCATSKRT